MKKKLVVLLMSALLISGLSLTAAFAADGQKDEGVTFIQEDGKVIKEADSGETHGGIGGLRVNSALPKLAKPVNLQWGKKWSGGVVDAPAGFIYFEVPDNGEETSYQGQYMFKIYKKGSEEPVYSTTYSSSVTQKTDEGNYHFDNFSFVQVANENDGGTYYFTIELKGDGINYSNSDVAKSPDWTWNKPGNDTKLPTPKDLKWNYPSASFIFSEGDYGSGAFDYFYSETGDTSSVSGSGGSYYCPESRKHSDGTVSENDSYFSGDYGFKQLQLHGNGYYYFKVRNLSYDITTHLNSDWSDFSKPYNMKALVDETNSALDQINKGDIGSIRPGVEAIGTEKLKAAMSADKEGKNAVKKIEELEKAYCGGPAKINVDNEVRDQFTDNNVSIIGANLNGDGNATLTFGSAKNDHEIPSQYRDNAFKFSMTLTGVDDEHKLKVPVQLILPVPGNMNPEFFRIIHFLSGGGSQVIDPYIFTIGEKTYAKFVITSFSDFAFVEESNNGGENNGGNGSGNNGVSDNNAEKDKPASSAPVITVSDNQPMDYSVVEKGGFKVGYNQSIPFFGKAKADAGFFGTITVSINDITYTASRIKLNKKKHKMQILELQGADKTISKAIKKATRGANGLPFKINPYFVRNTDSVKVKLKKDGSAKSVIINLKGKDYKAKKGEWKYDTNTKLVEFYGDNLNGGYQS